MLSPANEQRREPCITKAPRKAGRPSSLAEPVNLTRARQTQQCVRTVIAVRPRKPTKAGLMPIRTTNKRADRAVRNYGCPIAAIRNSAVQILLSKIRPSAIRPSKFGRRNSSVIFLKVEIWLSRILPSKIQPSKFGRRNSVAKIRPSEFGRRYLAFDIRPSKFCCQNPAVKICVKMQRSKFGCRNSAVKIRPSKFGRRYLAVDIWPLIFGRQNSAVKILLSKLGH